MSGCIKDTSKEEIKSIKEMFCMHTRVRTHINAWPSFELVFCFVVVFQMPRAKGQTYGMSFQAIWN